MIDWLKAELPMTWAEPICGGHVVHVSPAGDVERQTVKSHHVRGSYDEHITLRTVAHGAVEFDGNPAKFLQGHNLCGSDDVPALAQAAMLKALRLIGREPEADDVLRWGQGDFQISRLDVTAMFELDNGNDVRAWIRAASEQARMRWRGRGQVVGDTLYFGKVAKGKRASNWSLKCYSKGAELLARGRGHALPEDLPCRDELIAWADNKLRVELLLRTGELKRLDLAGDVENDDDENDDDQHRISPYQRGYAWTGDTAERVFDRYFAKLELGENVMLPIELEEGLKPALRLAYNSWKAGHDLAGLMPRATFYRYRKQLLDATAGAVDITVPQAKSNVVPLRRVLALRPVTPPAFLSARPDLLFRRAA